MPAVVPSSPLPRSVTPIVTAALADTPVVVLNGARQVGKTTLVRTLSYPGSWEVVTLDDPTARAAAHADPRGFLDRRVDTLVIDEVQLEPSLFRAIKASVDLDRRPGRFLLTGSSRLLAADDMAAALVGRVELIELGPFSQAEADGLGDHDVCVVDRLFEDHRDLLRSGTTLRPEYFDRVLRGGFPEAVSRAPSRRSAWYESYVKTVTHKVIRELADVERLVEIPRLLALAAGRTGTELNVASLAAQMAIPTRTTSAYLATLANAFLLRLVPAWSTNLSAKVVRRPKLTMVDSGLAAHLCGVTAGALGPSPGKARPNPLLGPLLETLVAGEVYKQLAWSRQNPSMWHFRDRSGAEVDFLLEHPDGRLVGIEVKATSTPRDSDFRGLRFVADRLGDRFAFGALLSAAPEATPFGPKLAALPISALWAPSGSRPSS